MYVIAADLESIGGRDGCVQMGLVMIAYNPNENDIRVVEGLDACSWHPKEMEIHPDTLEFWVKPEQEKQLNALAMRTDQTKTRSQTITNMIRSFMDTLYRMMEEHPTAVFVVDNKAFDVHLVTQMTEQYLPEKDYRALPFYPTYNDKGERIKFKYGSLFETHSMQYGFLLAVDGAKYKDKVWGLTAALNELAKERGISLPVLDIEHDHNAVNDATTIAAEYVSMMILSGAFQKEEEEEEEVKPTKRRRIDAGK